MADLSTCPPLTRASVVEAHRIVAPHVHRTPVVTNRTLSELASRPRAAEELRGTRWEGRTPAAPRMRLWFKCENMQRVGAFKVRPSRLHFHHHQHHSSSHDLLVQLTLVCLLCNAIT